MSQLRMYTLFDVAVSSFLKPFWSDHKANAIRALQQLVNESNNPDNNVANHPDQFVLFELGYFDDQSGVFHGHATPLSLGNAIEFKSIV